MARFFIDRPVFAWVIAIFIMLGGLFAIRALPVAQYPDIAPPVVSIYATYPGASAQVVEESVTALIEREMNGAPGLLYTSATSSAGAASLYLTFKGNTDQFGLAVIADEAKGVVERSSRNGPTTMQRQIGFAEAESAGKKRVTKRQRFLAEMEKVVPWSRLLSVIGPYYPKGERGRPPIGLERMLRIYLLQQWYG
ncbi:efflux RND transporter permease subunit, partial [Burkholderia cenocepacia]